MAGSVLLVMGRPLAGTIHVSYHQATAKGDPRLMESQRPKKSFFATLWPL